MNVAIFSSLGGGSIPSFIKLDSNKFWRVSLAEELLKLKESENPKKDFIKLEKKEIDFIRYENIIYLKDEIYGYIFTITIEDIDISKKWRIKDNNGKEFIEYLVEPILINKELNLYE